MRQRSVLVARFVGKRQDVLLGPSRPRPVTILFRIAELSRVVLRHGCTTHTSIARGWGGRSRASSGRPLPIHAGWASDNI